ncbi:MAG: TetR/AcrR family transcriptional regulator, partial [Solirubrobacterales bacterium]|nr:TetR/AcrR family transcriptional regulator [Solirubrobacterales bacterium]
MHTSGSTRSDSRSVPVTSPPVPAATSPISAPRTGSRTQRRTFRSASRSRAGSADNGDRPVGVGTYAWRVPTSLERRHNRRRRHERTRLELIEAALNQASAGSFKDLTVEGITREAGVARSAFYVYFGDKEELLLGALEDLIASHQNRLGRCWLKSDDPRRDIERGIYGMSRVYADSSELLALAGE